MPDHILSNYLSKHIITTAVTNYNYSNNMKVNSKHAHVYLPLGSAFFTRHDTTFVVYDEKYISRKVPRAHVKHVYL